MSRVMDYAEKLADGGIVELDGPGGEALAILPPDHIDPEAGFAGDLTAHQTVELLRALQAWVIVHADTHPEWHRRFRNAYPGGLPKRYTEALRMWVATGVSVQDMEDGR